MQIVIRNRFREAYLAGKLEEIPEYARQATIDLMESQSNPIKKVELPFSQFVEDDAEDEG